MVIAKKSVWALRLFLLVLFAATLFIFLKVFSQPQSIVLPHHNLVAGNRSEFIKTISRRRLLTQKIILIGPDHFSPNQNQLLYSNVNWNLSNGTLPFTASLETQLSPFLHLQNQPLKSDHAIYNILADIKTNFPKSSVFPILVGQKVAFEKLDPLINQVSQICSFDCLVVASVDFSHYLPAALADVHDQKSLAALAAQDLGGIANLEVDSPQSLYFLVKYSRPKNADNWQLFGHTNSGFIANNPVVETTTHVFGSYSRSPLPHPRPIPVTTFTFSQTDIVKQNNLDSLGERFFYGVDVFKTNQKLPHNLTTSITINPSSSFSVDKSADHLTVSYPPDIILSGYLTSSTLHLVLNPIKTDSRQVFFDRDSTRLPRLQSLFSPLSSVATVNADLGTIDLNLK
ncbi:MAG: AmmeMemoRadiSam system protein B [Candidatus Shapirobacteria bacterium]|jgi:AmmeMemoRadiSam system protein B